MAEYEYVHPAAGMLRCQHALLDAGAYEVCTTGSADAPTHPKLSVFPNPATDRLFLSGNGSGDERAMIIDASGRMVALPYIHGPWIDVSGLRPGLYALLLIDGPGVTRAAFVKH